MRIATSVLLLSLLAATACQPANDGNAHVDASDLLSETWRQRRLQEAFSEAEEIRRKARGESRVLLDSGGYDLEITHLAGEIESGDVHRIADALFHMLWSSDEKVPVEILVSFVVPLLDDRRGYVETTWDGPPCGTPSSHIGDISLSAAQLLRVNAAGNRDLVPILLQFVVAGKRPQCDVTNEAISAIVDAASDPGDVEFATLALVEVVLMEPWDPELRSWEQRANQRRLCDPRQTTGRLYKRLRDQHPECQWLGDRDVMAVFYRRS